MLEHAPLEEVNIFFDTATYDEIEKDVRVKQNNFGSLLNVFPLGMLTCLDIDKLRRSNMF